MTNQKGIFSCLRQGIQLLVLGFGGLAGMADIVFEFDYSKSADFNESGVGAVRKAALEEAARTLGSVFEDNAVIQVEVTSENDSRSDTLASASSNFVDVAFDFIGFTPSVIERKVLQGIDDNGAEADGIVSINFGIEWDFDDEIAADKFDFKATMIHELLHALGFASSIAPDGSDAYGFPPGEPGVWSPFDRFLSDLDGRMLIDDQFVLSGMLWESLSTGGTSPGAGLFFNGPETLDVNGGKPVGLYSPSEWSEGSSGSHLDDDNPALAGLLMLAATAEGPYTRELMDIERAMLTDLGYTLKPRQTSPVDPVENESVALQMTIRVEGGRAAITLIGNSGRYRLEASDDFKNWEYLDDIILQADGDLVTLEDELFDLQFYRVLPSTEP